MPFMAANSGNDYDGFDVTVTIIVLVLIFVCTAWYVLNMGA